MWQDHKTDSAASLLTDGIASARQITDPLLVSGCSEALAWVLAEQKKFRRAAVLMGAADALGHAAGASVFMFDDLAKHRGHAERRCRNALGTKAFEAACEKGASMNLDAVTAFALRDKSEPITPATHPSGQLTKRERQVARLVADGLTNKAIAARLVISQRTAEGHVEHILTKLGFTSRIQIVAWMVEQPEPSMSE